MIRKHSITLRGHRTSFSLENPFMDELRMIADERDLALAALITEIDEIRDPTANLSSALRLYVLNWLKAKAQRT
ncbi:MAG: aryl-sulfate sulfotransferase [Shinella sp.]|nr:MAG: aryl-sulfate sulfotransferase [Shinella sp.]